MAFCTSGSVCTLDLWLGWAASRSRPGEELCSGCFLNVRDSLRARLPAMELMTGLGCEVTMGGRVPDPGHCVRGAGLSGVSPLSSPSTRAFPGLGTSRDPERDVLRTPGSASRTRAAEVLVVPPQLPVSQPGGSGPTWHWPPRSPPLSAAGGVLQSRWTPTVPAPCPGPGLSPWQ